MFSQHFHVIMQGNTVYILEIWIINPHIKKEFRGRSLCVYLSVCPDVKIPYLTNSVFHDYLHDVSRLNDPSGPSQTGLPVTIIDSRFKKSTKTFLGRKKKTFGIGSRTNSQCIISNSLLTVLKINLKRLNFVFDNECPILAEI